MLAGIGCSYCLGLVSYRDMVLLIIKCVQILFQLTCWDSFSHVRPRMQNSERSVCRREQWLLDLSDRCLETTQICSHFLDYRLVLPKPNTVYIVKNSAYGAIFNPSSETRINMPGARDRYILWNCLLFYKETKYITIKITKSFWVPKLTWNVYKDKIAYWVLREVCWGKLAQISSSSVPTDHKYLIILISFKLR